MLNSMDFNEYHFDMSTYRLKKAFIRFKNRDKVIIKMNAVLFSASQIRDIKKQLREQFGSNDIESINLIYTEYGV